MKGRVFLFFFSHALKINISFIFQDHISISVHLILAVYVGLLGDSYMKAGSYSM